MPAEAILMALEAARDAALTSANAAQKAFGSALRRQLRFMDGDGIDFGAQAFLDMVTQLEGAGVWTKAQGDLLRGIARVDDPVTHTEVGFAVEGSK
jgi:hypothetical protein